MHGVRRGGAAMCILIGVAVMSASAQGAEAPKVAGMPTVRALFVSDIHFEPFWDPGKAEKLAAAPVGEWKAILTAPDTADREARFAELQEKCKTRGEDTSIQLLESSLQAMRTDAKGAKFVIVSGDLISHSFSCKYATVLPNTGPDEYRRFAEKTVEFVVESLRGILPGVPVYAALGNNDSGCGDYQLDANSEFLAATGKVMTADIRTAQRATALQEFAAYGDYSVTLPTPMERTRLLVVDDLFMSRRYETCGGKEDDGPETAQIEWLKQQLSEARRRHEKVWVMSHIPPGVDAYSTATKGKNICAGSKATMFLSSEALPETLAEFGDVIRLAIFAHTHMDEIRLLEPAKKDEKGVAVKMVPSISPVDGNNPSFVVAAIDPVTAVMKDYRVIAASNKTGIDTTWEEEYDFAQTYKEPNFSAATLKDLVGRFEADGKAQTSESQSYIHDYDVGEPMRALNLFWPQYVCALKNDEAEAFSRCVCGGTP